VSPRGSNTGGSLLDGNGGSGLRGTQHSTARRHTGVIAQELEEVLPEAVYDEVSTGMKTIAYGNVVGLLVEAIKELTARVSAVERAVAV